MEDILQSIQTAIAGDANDEARAAGVSACRAILNALEARPGQPLTHAPVSSGKAPPMPNATTQVAAVVTALRTMPVEQILDLAIARLRAALPQGTDAPPITPLKFQFIPPSQEPRGE